MATVQIAETKSATHSVENAVSEMSAQVSAADLANSLLSAQSAVATNYVNLRAADSQVQLLTDTVVAYSRTMTITENQYAAGTASRSDLEIARTQLRSAQAQLAGVGVQRAQFEHAIAVLTGHAPSELTVGRVQMSERGTGDRGTAVQGESEAGSRCIAAGRLRRRRVADRLSS